MQLSKRCEYAIKALIELALNHEKGVDVTLISDIADRENIPLRYLEHILLSMKKAGLLQSKRGVGGGYALGRATKDITLGEVIRIVDGPVSHGKAVKIGTELSQRDAISFCLQNILEEVGSELAAKLEKNTLRDMALETFDLIQQKRNTLNYVI